MSKISNIKKENIIQLLISIAIIVAVNIIAVYYFYRIDMTQEKRYSLTKSTKEIVKNVQDVVYIKVYLDGDLPAPYKQLKNSVRELLDEFRAYNTDIQYEFINPSAEENKTKREQFYHDLAAQGLAYYQVPVENKDGFAQKFVFPSAMISYRDRSVPLNFMQTSRMIPTDVDIVNSIQRVELSLITAIRKLTQKKPLSIAFAQGHGELQKFELYDLGVEISQSYNSKLINIGTDITTLTQRTQKDSVTTKIENKFDMLIVAKPDSFFDDKSKFLIDQFIMYGGKVIWLVDAVEASMDSLRNSTTTFGIRKDVGLYEMLYRYGVRLNPSLLLNRNALEIGTPEGQLRVWDYFPVALPVPGSPITENLNTVRTQFVSPLDIVGSEEIKKTVLLQTDKRTRIMPSPAIINIVDIIYRTPNKALYNAPPQNIAVLLEGEFESYFSHKIIDPRISENKDFGILYKSKPTSQLVISCGDIIRNQLQESGQGMIPLPLGYDRFSQRTYDNKKFLMNSINYMLGDKDLINLRNKDYKIRLLNKEEVDESRLKWQLINTVIPVVVIIILGFFLFILKRKKFAH